MDDYPCLYCGGHPDLESSGAAVAAVRVNAEDLLIRIAGGEVRVPLRLVTGVEDRPVRGTRPACSLVRIVADGDGGAGRAGCRIILRFTNEYFAKALVLRLRLASGEIGGRGGTSSAQHPD